MKVNIKKVHKDAKIPEYKTDGAVCADLYAVFKNNFGYTYIHPNQTEIISTGLAVEVPEGWELQIRARSGLASQGVILSNGVGTVDSDYRGVVGVILTNTGSDVMKISTGDRIAQCCLSPVHRIEFVEKDNLTDTNRGGNGFGSTGK